MKTLLLFLTVCLLSFQVKAQDDCKLIENLDPTLKNVSYQTVFVTAVAGKDKFNIKFWKFTNKFTINCFVVTKDTFCVDLSSSVTFNFSDGSKFTFNSDKKQNCRAELDKDFTDEKLPGENFSLYQKKIVSINVAGIRSNKSFITDEKTATSIRSAFRCIVQKEIK